MQQRTARSDDGFRAAQMGLYGLARSIAELEWLLLLLVMLNPPLPSLAQIKQTPAIYFSGGVYGVIFVTTILMLAPRIGIANTLVATIIGQLIISVILDHFGVFGLLRHPVNGFRLLGCVGLMISLYLIQKSG